MIRQRSAKWLIDEAVALGEQKEALITILNKAVRKQGSKKRREEIERKIEVQKQRRPEAKKHRVERQRQQAVQTQRPPKMMRLLNVKVEGGKKSPHADTTKVPAIKAEPGWMPNNRAAPNVGERHFIKQEIVKEELRIRAEPTIKTEED